MMDWARMLVYFAGTVDEELLLLNEHLAAENRIPRAQTKGRLLLSDAEKAALADIGHRRGRKCLWTSRTRTLPSAKHLATGRSWPIAPIHHDP